MRMNQLQHRDGGTWWSTACGKKMRTWRMEGRTHRHSWLFRQCQHTQLSSWWSQHTTCHAFQLMHVCVRQNISTLGIYEKASKYSQEHEELHLKSFCKHPKASWLITQQDDINMLLDSLHSVNAGSTFLLLKTEAPTLLDSMIKKSKCRLLQEVNTKCGDSEIWIN